MGFFFLQELLNIFPVRLELAFLASFQQFRYATEPGNVTEYERNVEGKTNKWNGNFGH